MFDKVMVVVWEVASVLFLAANTLTLWATFRRK